MIDYETSIVNTNSVAFPDTEAVNVSAPGAGDGTEFVALLVNDIWGRVQALMDYAGLTPDGVMEAPGTAQIIEALCKGLGVGPGYRVMYDKAGSPAANGDRVLLLQGQVVAIASYPLLVAACYVGDGSNATAPCYYKTSDAEGTTRDTSGTYFVLPDTRGLSPKGVGNATVNTRTKTGPASLGEVQEDQIQGHKHNITRYATGFGAGSSVVAGPNSGSMTEAVSDPITDGINGTPRTGANTRDSSIGTNFGIVY